MWHIAETDMSAADFLKKPWATSWQASVIPSDLFWDVQTSNTHKSDKLTPNHKAINPSAPDPQPTLTCLHKDAQNAPRADFSGSNLWIGGCDQKIQKENQLSPYRKRQNYRPTAPWQQSLQPRRPGRERWHCSGEPVAWWGDLYLCDITQAKGCHWSAPTPPTTDPTQQQRLMGGQRSHFM